MTTPDMMAACTGADHDTPAVVVSPSCASLLALTVAVALVVDWYLGWFLAIAAGIVIAGLLDPG